MKRTFSTSLSIMLVATVPAIGNARSNQPAQPSPSSQPAQSPPASPPQAMSPASDDPTAQPPPAAGAAPAPATGRDIGKAPTFSGKGLIIGAAVAGGLGLVANVVRGALLGSTCIPDSLAEGEVYNTGFSCFASGGAIIAMSALAVGAGTASIGLAAGGGAVKGKYDAYHEAAAGGTTRKRNGVTLMTLGGVLMGLGIITPILTWSLAWTGTVTCTSAGCARGSIAGYLIGVQLGASMLAAGTGLLAYGASYHNHARSYGMSRFKLMPAPIVSRDQLGFGLVGRF